MYFTKTFAIALAFAVLDIASAIPQNKNGGNNNNNGGNNNSNNGGNANNGNNGGNNNAASLTLLAANLQSASETDGNPNKTAGQSASLTDKANFINFCSGKTITDGKQVTGGSCNGIVMGDMPSQANMVSSIIINPGPGDNIDANTEFKIQVQVANLLAGTFTNPQDTYYAAPQQLSGGKIIGHTHVVIQNLGNSLTPSTPPDAKTFAFFKGIDDNGNGNGLLSATVAGGLPAGNYRVCSMSSSSNHQPVLMPVAQRGAQDDCQKFTVGGKGGNTKATGSTGTGAGTGTNAGIGNGANSGTGTGTTTKTAAGTNTGTSTTGNQNGRPNNNNPPNPGNNNGNVNNGNNGNNGSDGATKTTTTSSAAASNTDCNGGRNRQNCQNDNGNQNVNGQANNGGGNNNNGGSKNSGNDRSSTSSSASLAAISATAASSTSTENVKKAQQTPASSTQTVASAKNAQQTGMMDNSGMKNGVTVERRRFQAREFIS